MMDALTMERTHDASRNDSPTAFVYPWQSSNWGMYSTTPTGQGIAPGRTLLIEKSFDFDKWQQKVDSLAALADGWNGYDAPAPSKLARETAKRFLSQLGQRAEPARVAPSAEGGVGVTHRAGPRRVYVEFFNDGEVCALFSDDASSPVSKSVSPDFPGFKNLIDEIRNYLNA